MRFLPLALLAVSTLQAGVITLGPSNQIFTLTGIGPDSSGNGQSKMSWGNCTYDGVTTTCTVSGNYTGLGSGGTYAFIVSYAGNGPFPLIAVTSPPSTDYFYASTIGNFNFIITLTPTVGPPINFYSFYNFSFLFSNPTCTGLSANNCSVHQVGQSPGTTISGPITGSFDPTPVINVNQVITASGYGGFSSIAPASWIEVYGYNLSTVPSAIWSDSFVGDQAPTNLSGTSVTIAGKPAFILYTATNLQTSQVNVQVPDGVPSGLQPLVVTTAGGSSLPYMVNVNEVEPGLLAIPSFAINGRQYVVALFSSNLTTFVFPKSIVGATTSRARVGDNITLYGVGFGITTPQLPAGQIVRKANNLSQKFQITFGGVPAVVSYAGLVNSAVGLYQFNVTVPNVAASDTVPLQFTLNGTPGLQTLYIPVQ